MTVENRAWQLEDFVDSLIVELDKTRETLAVKAINRPLSYTVKELALDLNTFPTYDGDQVKFTTAQPGQEGASKVTIQLGSITDQQVRATTKAPPRHNDIPIDEIDVDSKTKKELRKLGVSSIDDLQQIQQKNVDLRKASDDTIDYRNLAAQIARSQRKDAPPRVTAVSMSRDDGQTPYLTIQGENLAVDPRFAPVAVVNHKLADVVAYDRGELTIKVAPGHDLATDNEVILTLDPFAVLRMNVKDGG
jgi:hypothetical protein